MAVGILLLLLYVLPLFVPPPATEPLASAAPGIWQRVFPDVPTWWVLGRLACLFAGAGLVAWSIRGRLPLTLGDTATIADAGDPALPIASHAAPWVALLLAAAHAAAGLYAPHFSRLGETAYFAFLALPSGILAWTEASRARRVLRRTAPRLMLLLIVPLFWVALSAPAAWRSPRAANLIDMWVMVERLENVVLGQQTILSDSTGPGHTNAYMMLEGVWLFGPDRPVSFVGLQIAHCLVAVVCAVAVGAVVWQMVGRGAALVAQAALVFSPYGLSSLYEPAPMLFTALCAVLLLLLIVVARRFRSAAALAAFGPMAGVSSTDPPVVLTALLLCALMAYSVLRWPRIPWLAVGVAALSGAAAVLPSLPTPQLLAAMARSYTLGRAQLDGIVLILFGQESPFNVARVLKAAQSGPLDLPIGALLAPFAIMRSPHRLWGDVLFDPVATALMSIGLALCLLHVRRNRAARAMLGLLLAGLIGGFTSAGDAVSHTRIAPGLIPLVVLSGLGFEVLRRAVVPAGRPTLMAMLAAGAITVSGIALYERITPTILPASWLAISLEALGARTPNADAVFLQHDEPRNPPPGTPVTLRWLFVGPIARLLPARPFPARTMGEFERSELTSADPPDRVYFWSPGLEQDAGVTRTICARWPATALYTLMDEPRLFRALAAAPRGVEWRPRLPEGRWTVASCPPAASRP